MKTIEKFMNYRLFLLVFATSILTLNSCSDDDDAPEEEEEVEVITNVTLTFTNTADATDVVTVTAQDPDGEGIQGLIEAGEINLSANTTYTLTYEILNALDPDDVEDIGDEILEEDNEHQFFFSFTDGVFADPTGDGNIDTASDELNYDDEDENGNPVGLSTTWTTSSTASTGGTFNVRLQHQPDLKSATTGADDGDTDFDLDFVLNIQ